MSRLSPSRFEVSSRGRKVAEEECLLVDAVVKRIEICDDEGRRRMGLEVIVGLSDLRRSEAVVGSDDSL